MPLTLLGHSANFARETRHIVSPCNKVRIHVDCMNNCNKMYCQILQLHTFLTTGELGFDILQLQNSKMQ